MPSAGVYKKEVDLSLYVEIASNLTIGLVHTFAKGPINEKTLITNNGSLEAIFGRPIDDDMHSQGWLAAEEYLKAGNQLYVVRAESAANPAQYARMGLRGATDASMATNTDATTSAAATRTLTSSAASFITAGVLIGDVLQVASGPDAGLYKIVNVAATILTIDRDWPTGAQSAQTYTVWTSKREVGTDGATSAPSSRTFTSAGSTFITNGVQAGDVLSIVDAGTPGDDGFYTILSVTSETSVVVNRDFISGSLSSLSFTVYGGNHPAGSDGSTAVAGEFLSASAKFQLHGVQAGDLLIIADTSTPANDGTYMITGVKTGSEQTILTIDNDVWPAGSLTSLSYRVVPGSVYFQAESKGTWANDYSFQPVVSSISGTQFNLQIFDGEGFQVDTVYNLSLANVTAKAATDSSLFPVATVGSNRLGPALKQTQIVRSGEDGTDGITDADLIGTGTNGLQQFKNIEDVELDLLMITGYSSQNLGDALLAMAEFRGDCVACIDPPDFPTVDTSQEVYNWHNGEGGFGRSSSLNSSYGTLCWPWGKKFDRFNNKDRWCAPSGVHARVITQSANATQRWFAPAGITRGKVPGWSVLRHSPDLGERDLLQVQGSVNPIVKFKKEGICVFGQKTLLRSTSALNRLSVRFMLLFAERNVLAAARLLTFEPNDPVTDREFVRLVTPLFEFIQLNRGLREFLVICDDTTSPPAVRAQNKLVAKIFLKPTTTAEVIEVQFILTAQTANFTELLAA